MFIFSSKAKKNKPKKLLNLLVKPVQQKVKLVNSDKNIVENVSDNELNELDDTEDDHEDSDEDETKDKGISNCCNFIKVFN